MFEEFETIDHENEDMFEFMAFNIVIQYLEKSCLCLPEDADSNEAIS